MEEPIMKKKNGITDKAIQKQKQILVVAVLLVITLFIGTSYSLLTNFDQNNSVTEFVSGNLKLRVNDPLKGLISLSGTASSNDEEGLKNAIPMVLTFTNTGSQDIKKYVVKLEKDKTSTIDTNYIKYAISLDNGVSYTKPSILANSNDIIYTGYNLGLNKSKTIFLKVFLDSSLNSTNKTNVYNGKMTIDLYENAQLPYATAEIKKNLDTESLVPISLDGSLYNDTGEIREYRYCGVNVKNYVTFNNELWRIIGIFKENDQEMLKLVSNKILDSKKIPTNYQINSKTYILKEETESSNNIYWNNSTDLTNVSNWTESGLQYYLNSEKDELNNRGYLGYFSNLAKSMLQDTTYYLGNLTTANKKIANPIIAYTNEHNTLNVTKGNKGTWIGKVGLMYPSDIGYSTSKEYWNTNLNESEIAKNSWLYQTLDNNDQGSWLITPSAIQGKDKIGLTNVNEITEEYQNDYNVRAVVYLKPNVLITGGDGTIDFPYQLEI